MSRRSRRAGAAGNLIGHERAGRTHSIQNKKPMEILVPVKRVLNFNVRARVKPDGSGVDLANARMSMNPFDEIAAEEAVRVAASWCRILAIADNVRVDAACRPR